MLKSIWYFIVLTLFYSYTFNHHLLHSIHSRLMKLHSMSIENKDKILVATVTEMMLLSKFLGFLVSLPYELQPPSYIASNDYVSDPISYLM